MRLILFVFINAVKDLIMNLEEPIFSGDEWETTDLIDYTQRADTFIVVCI